MIVLWVRQNKNVSTKIFTMTQCTDIWLSCHESSTSNWLRWSELGEFDHFSMVNPPRDNHGSVTRQGAWSEVRGFQSSVYECGSSRNELNSDVCIVCQIEIPNQQIKTSCCQNTSQAHHSWGLYIIYQSGLARESRQQTDRKCSMIKLWHQQTDGVHLY